MLGRENKTLDNVASGRHSGGVTGRGGGGCWSTGRDDGAERAREVRCRCQSSARAHVVTNGAPGRRVGQPQRVGRNGCTPPPVEIEVVSAVLVCSDHCWPHRHDQVYSYVITNTVRFRSAALLLCFLIGGLLCAEYSRSIAGCADGVQPAGGKNQAALADSLETPYGRASGSSGTRRCVASTSPPRVHRVDGAPACCFR